MKKHKYHPESLMMSLGYRPEWSEGTIKCPIFQTSTFSFRTAEEGADLFELAYGLRDKKEDEPGGLIYSRLNNPSVEILEERLSVWDGAEAGAVFSSGMAAISTTLLTFLKPGDLLLYSKPLYGGTIHFIEHILPGFGIHVMGFTAEDDLLSLERKLIDSGLSNKLAMIFIESPANPTNDIYDIEMCATVAKHFSNPEKKVLFAVDNTFMGPLWQKPLNLGADLVIYSATKYIGGHSDVIAGAVVSSQALIDQLKNLRTFLGCILSPMSSWLLLRSLETVKLRMEQQARNAEAVAQFLDSHSKVCKVNYLGLLSESDGVQYDRYLKQFSSPGAMISFEVKGGKEEAFQFLNGLKLVKLAVSLGSTESLAQHPATMTHVGMTSEEKLENSITDNLVRLSIGVEDANDIIFDIGRALETVGSGVEVF